MNRNDIDRYITGNYGEDSVGPDTNIDVRNLKPNDEISDGVDLSGIVEAIRGEYIFIWWTSVVSAPFCYPLKEFQQYVNEWGFVKI